MWYVRLSNLAHALFSCSNDNAPSTGNKKNKKSALVKNASASALDPNDYAALNRRAQRFQREHEIERKKALQYGHSSSVQASRLGSRSGTPGLYGDEPEADPVRRAFLFRTYLMPCNLLHLECTKLGPLYYCWNMSRSIQGIPTVNLGKCHGISPALFPVPIIAQEPKPEQIRPYDVLQKTLTELKKRWREKANYNWICSQFKSLRQDLTVRLPLFVYRVR